MYDFGPNCTPLSSITIIKIVTECVSGNVLIFKELLIKIFVTFGRILVENTCNLPTNKNQHLAENMSRVVTIF